MEKTKYFIDYNLETKKVISVSIVKNKNHMVEIELSETEFNNFCDNLDFYFIINDKPILSESYKTVYLNKINLRDRVNELTFLLSKSDYKIIKCYEAFMRQLPLPYNLEELTTQRDAWRAEINQLEEELKAL